MISKIVVGVDFSDASRRALEHGAEWARMLDVPLLAVHVLSVPVPSPMGMEVPSIPPESGWFEGLEEDASKRLQDWGKGVPKAVGQVCWGAASAKLLEYADQDTLLVVARKSHSALEHLLFGGTANQVVRHAPCDVLVVH